MLLNITAKKQDETTISKDVQAEQAMTYVKELIRQGYTCYWDDERIIAPKP